MAGLIRQFTSLLKNSVGSLLEPAEDPRATFSNPEQRQDVLLARVREALAQNAALHKRLQGRLAQLQAKIPQLEQLARQAVAAGRDDLARLALQQSQLACLELNSLQASLEEVQLEERRIAIIEQRLTAQIEAIRVRQQMTAMRYTSAESQVLVNEAINGVSRELSELGQTIEQTEQKTEHMQARASAIEQLSEYTSLDLAATDPLARQIGQLDIASEVERQLAELKQQPRNPAE